MTEPTPAAPGTAPAPLLGASDVRRLAEEVGVRPTKTLGQNFVIDGNTIRRIVAAADIHADETVLEVGPGLGSLTLGLLDAAKSVVAVEIDPVLAGKLPDTVQQWRPGRRQGFPPGAGGRHEGDRTARRADSARGEPSLQRGGAGGAAPPAALPEPPARTGHGPGRGGGPAGCRSRIQDLRSAVGEGSLVQQHAQGRRDRHECLLAGAEDPFRARGLHPP